MSHKEFDTQDGRTMKTARAYAISAMVVRKSTVHATHEVYNHIWQDIARIGTHTSWAISKHGVL